MRAGLIAEYGDATALVRAVHALRGHGHARIETYTPFPVDDLDLALAAPRPRIGAIAGAAGLLGAAGAYGLEWLLDAYLYPVNAGGRPPHMPLAYVPIAFEMGVLAAALAAFACVIAVGPRLALWHPLDEVPGFASETRAGFWLALGLEPGADEAAAAEALAATAPRRIERVEGGAP